MAVDRLRREISEFLQFSVPHDTIPFETHTVVKEHDHDRLRITYHDEDSAPIPAFLLIPQGAGPFPAILVHHQHNAARHGH